MKYSDIQSKKPDEAKHLLEEKRTRLRELLFLSSQGKVKNVREMRAVKKDIAQVLTYLNQVKK